MATNIVSIIIKAVDLASKEFLKADKNAGSLRNGVAKLAAQLGVAAIAGVALKKALDFTKESALLAARVDTLGAVTQIMGRNAGISAAEVRELEAGIQSMGITTQASRQALAQMMRAEIDLAKATDLARLAQDAAVISGENSSEAFDKLTQIIGTGNTFMARRMGLLVDFNGAYEKLADQLDRSADDLTQLEKVQARTNEVMAQGKTIAGAYESAMETGGKQIQSYARYSEELSLAVGVRFQTALKGSIALLTEFTKQLTIQVKAINTVEEAQTLGILSNEEYYEIQTKLKYGALDYEQTLEDLSFRIENVRTSTESTTESHRLMAEVIRTGSDAAFEGEEAWTRYGEAQSEYAERAADGINALNQTKNAIDAAKTAAQEAAGAMTEYFGLFDNTDNVDVAANLTDQLSDHLVTAATGATAAGEDIQPWIDALEAYDPLAASALENSTILAGTLDALDTALTAKGITPQEYAAAMEAIALGIEAGVEPGAAMETQLAKLGLEIGKEDETLIGFQGSLDTLVAGSPYEIEVRTTFTQSGQLPSGIGGASITVPITGGGGNVQKRAAGGPVNAFDPYWVGESGPELIVPRSAGNVIPNDKVGTTITNNYYITNMNPETAAMNAALIKSNEMAQLRNNQ